MKSGTRSTGSARYERGEQKLAHARDPLVAEQPPEENDAVGHEAGQSSGVGSSAHGEQHKHEQQREAERGCG